jgi:hypothetical protein
MKTLKLIAVGIIFFATSSLQAQISVNVNIGSAPSWGPQGYPEVAYYYLPDIQAYYDIRASQFIYLNNGIWDRSRNLPYRYKNYDLYNGYKVVLNDYHGTRPYDNYKDHKVRYYKGYNKGHQKTISVRSNTHRDDNNNQGNKNKNRNKNEKKEHKNEKH